MFSQKNNINSICLIDFGIGFKPSFNLIQKSKCGTKIYMPP